MGEVQNKRKLPQEAYILHQTLKWHVILNLSFDRMSISQGNKEALTHACATDADRMGGRRKLCASICSQLKTDPLIRSETRALSLFVSVPIGVKRQIMHRKIKGGTWGDHTDFKGKSSLPCHRLALPYITPSVPGCELRCLVSILNHKPKGRMPVWLSVYVWACFLFVYVSISPLLPSL